MFYFQDGFCSVCVWCTNYHDHSKRSTLLLLAASHTSSEKQFIQPHRQMHRWHLLIYRTDRYSKHHFNNRTALDEVIISRSDGNVNQHELTSLMTRALAKLWSLWLSKISDLSVLVIHWRSDVCIGDWLYYAYTPHLCSYKLQAALELDNQVFYL